MADKQLNTAQALLAHIGLKTKDFPIFGAMILVKQWTASERLKYMGFISNTEVDLDDEISIVRPQANIFALSLVNKNGEPLFKAKWQDNQPVFDDPKAIETFLQNRTAETSAAFIAIAKFNGIYFGDPEDEKDKEDTAVKN